MQEALERFTSVYVSTGVNVAAAAAQLPTRSTRRASDLESALERALKEEMLYGQEVIEIEVVV